ncbi:MAG: flagellar biosynthesis protein FliQ [Lachnospiraceae bacterium]|nr:flagellar biosynthesis protein FliQ [Lachnospiraceae bacterium]
MTEGQVLDVMRDSFYVILFCSMPMLLTSMIVGLIISVFQTVTSIQEQTLTFVPKVLAIFLALILFGSFILTTLLEYIHRLWDNFSIYIR